MQAVWLESNKSFYKTGLGAHPDNPRYDHIEQDAVDAGFDAIIAANYPSAIRRVVKNTKQRIQLLVTGTRFDGPDVAHYQYESSPINWPMVAASPATWAACKLTQSTSFFDTTSSLSRTGMRAAKFRYRGLYHWVSSTTAPLKQAAWFLAHLGTLELGEFAMLDCEETGVDVAIVLAVAQAIEAVTHRPCVIYTGGYFAGGTLWKSSALRMSAYGPRPFVLACYTSEKTATTIAGAYPWSSWQYSSNGPVQGVTGRCDMNRVDDPDAYELASGYGAVVVPPIPPKPPTPPVITGDTDMIIIHNTDDDWYATIDAGYAVGVEGPSLAANALAVLPVSRAVWAEYIAVSDAKKKADLAMANGITVTGGGTAPTHGSGSIDLNARTVDLTLS